VIQYQTKQGPSFIQKRLPNPTMKPIRNSYIQPSHQHRPSPVLNYPIRSFFIHLCSSLGWAKSKQCKPMPPQSDHRFHLRQKTIKIRVSKRAIKELNQFRRLSIGIELALLSAVIVAHQSLLVLDLELVPKQSALLYGNSSVLLSVRYHLKQEGNVPDTQCSM